MANHSSIIQRFCSEDIEEQSGALNGWHQEYRQISPGKFFGSVTTVEGARMTIVGETSNLALHQRVAPPPGTLAFGLVRHRDDSLQVNRRQVDTGALIVLEGGREYDFRTSGCTDLIGVSFESSLFDDPERSGFGALVNAAIARGVVPLQPGAADLLRQFWVILAGMLDDEAGSPDNQMLPLLAHTAQHNLVLALSMSPLGEGSGLSQSADRQTRVVRGAIAWMLANLGWNFSMADLCCAVHVSQRTLQYHFENCFGMSPQQYLKAMRLNAAQRMLRRLGKASSGSLVSIADIAAQCGYDHASRFAGDYRRQFGLLPSDTLRMGAQAQA